MHPDLNGLLALQDTDAGIDDLLRRERALDDRVSALDAERTALVAALRRAGEAVEGAEHRRREVAGKLDEHRSLEQRQADALGEVWKPREAAAAMTQVEMTRRVVAQEQEELLALGARAAELQRTAHAHEGELAALDARQSELRAEVERERSALAAELEAARSARAHAAARISRSMLTHYERLRARRGGLAMFALRGAACGHCNTAVPLQRRNTMAGGRTIELCEGCGALLYAAG